MLSPNGGSGINELDPLLRKVLSIRGDATVAVPFDSGFDDLAPRLDEALGSLELLYHSAEFWTRLPAEKNVQARRLINELLGTYEAIQGFKARDEVDPSARREALAEQFEAVYGKLYAELFTPLKVYLFSEKWSPADMQRFIQEERDFMDALKKNRQESEEIVKAMRESSSEVGVGRFEEVFRKQVRIHSMLAIAWLGTALGAALFMIQFILRMLDDFSTSLKQGTDVHYGLQVLLGKFLIVSFFSIIFLRIARNYDANMHLYTVNKHRLNSLRVFTLFVESSQNPQTRDAVLIQATRAIFDVGDSGFVTGSKEPAGFEAINIVDQFKTKRD